MNLNLQTCPQCGVTSPGGRFHTSGHLERMHEEGTIPVPSAHRVASFLEGYRAQTQLDPEDILGVWIRGEPEQRTLLVSDLDRLVKVAEAAAKVVAEAHEQYMLDPETESRIGRRLVELADALDT